MNKIELEKFIWETRLDFLNYMTKKYWVPRTTGERFILNEQAFKDLDNFGIKTETECKLAKENIDLKKQIESLKETIKLLNE